MEEDPKQRFTNRAAYYSRYRPHYPPTLIGFMEKELGLSKTSIIADIGSGTGILSELFLKHGNTVFAVEPNGEMRKTAEEQLATYPTFKSVKGSAEETTLPNSSVGFVTAAQSFHWFEPEKTLKEFIRILRPSGWVLLIWNIRQNSSPFMQAYDSLVNKFADRAHSRHFSRAKIGAEDLKRFLGNYDTKTFENHQTLDLQGLKGRLLSSSYVPLEGSPRYEDMLAELRRTFDTHQEHGTVQMEYTTEVYYSQLSR